MMYARSFVSALNKMHQRSISDMPINQALLEDEVNLDWKLTEDKLFSVLEMNYEFRTLGHAIDFETVFWHCLCLMQRHLSHQHIGPCCNPG